ncbi:MAG: RNA polymerase subunit sigma [Planctomycetaceae bacterium]|nr:RNA polymerase subunit sigma [Planctomycetaceae bacterium]
MSQVTQILNRISSGEQAAAGELLPLVYDELRKLAAAQMAAEASNQTLQPTALVHEAYLRLEGQSSPQVWSHAGHFFAAAAEAMRRILVERARRKQRVRHGGKMRRRRLDDSALVADDSNEDLLTLDKAITKLAAAEPEVAAVVSLHRFAGLTLEDTARAVDISTRTAYRYWAYARAWLLDEMEKIDD